MNAEDQELFQEMRREEQLVRFPETLSSYWEVVGA